MLLNCGRHVGGGDAHDDAEDRRHPAHPEVVRVAAVRGDVALVDVVGPDGVEGRDVAGHARHERGHQRRQPEPQQARGEILHEHHGDRHVVVEFDLAVLVGLVAINGLSACRRPCSVLVSTLGGIRPTQGGDQFRRGRLRRPAAGAGVRKYAFVRLGHQRNHAGNDDDGGNENLGNRGDHRRAPRGRHRLGRHRPLHHQEVGTPIAERQHETRARPPCQTTRCASGCGLRLPCSPKRWSTRSAR